MTDYPLVTAIMPTKGRPEMTLAAVASWRAQTWPNKELVLVDDIDDPSFSHGYEMEMYQQPPICYVGIPGDVPLGSKRNYGCELATGQFICHFDSDDLSRPDRIADQVGLLQHSGLAVVGYSSVLVHEMRHARITIAAGLEYMWDRSTPSHQASPWWRMRSMKDMEPFGASIMYRKGWWADHRFPDVACGEDDAFSAVAVAAKQMIVVAGGDRLTVTNHDGNFTARVPLSNWQELPVDYKRA